MGSHFIVKNLCCRHFLRPLEIRLTAGVSISREAPFHKNQLQWKVAYSQYPRHQFTKSRDLGPSQSVYFSSRCSSFSSSKIKFFRWYLGKLESRPLVTKCITTSLIFIAADLTSQTMTVTPSKSFDSIRTLRMAAYGMLILAPAQHLWFNSVSKVLPKQDTLTTLKKVFMGQALLGPCITTVFFSYNAALQGESRDEIVARLKRDLLPTMKNGLMYWPMCDFLTFKFVPVHLQPLLNSSFSYLWTIYLTYMASLKKA